MCSIAGLPPDRIRNSWQLQAACNHIPYFLAEFPTYAEVLSEHGYFVGMTVKGWSPGVAKDAQGQDRLMAGRPFNGHTLQPPTPHIAAADYAGNFGDFLAAVPHDTPWCFWYGSVEPHRAYEYGSGVAKGHKSLSDIDRVPGFWPDNETVRNDLLDYAFEIEYFDSHLAKMLQQLEQRGELDNTLVVVTSDNGMPFPRVKGQEYGTVESPAPGHHVERRHSCSWSDHRRLREFHSSSAPTFVAPPAWTGSRPGLAPATGQSLTDIFFSYCAGQVVPSRDHVLIGKERHDVGLLDDQRYPIRRVSSSMACCTSTTLKSAHGGRPATRKPVISTASAAQPRGRFSISAGRERTSSPEVGVLQRAWPRNCTTSRRSRAPADELSRRPRTAIHRA